MLTQGRARSPNAPQGMQHEQPNNGGRLGEASLPTHPLWRIFRPHLVIGYSNAEPGGRLKQSSAQWSGELKTTTRGGLLARSTAAPFYTHFRNRETAMTQNFRDSSIRAKTVRACKMTAGRAALLGLMHRYLAALMDPFVSLLEMHKLMYFMQEAGEELRLRYDKGLYGPYADNLRHVLSHIEGHFIQGYGDAEDDPEKQIELTPDAVKKAEAFLTRHSDTREHFDRVVDLVEGFETPFGMELLSTVHWVATREGASTVEQAIAKTHAWNPRKQMFEPAQIRIAWNMLQQKGWLSQGRTSDAPE